MAQVDDDALVDFIEEDGDGGRFLGSAGVEGSLYEGDDGDYEAVDDFYEGDEERRRRRRYGLPLRRIRRLPRLRRLRRLPRLRRLRRLPRLRRLRRLPRLRRPQRPMLRRRLRRVPRIRSLQWRRRRPRRYTRFGTINPAYFYRTRNAYSEEHLLGFREVLSEDYRDLEDDDLVELLEEVLEGVTPAEAEGLLSAILPLVGRAVRGIGRRLSGRIAQRRQTSAPATPARPQPTALPGPPDQPTTAIGQLTQLLQSPQFQQALAALQVRAATPAATPPVARREIFLGSGESLTSAPPSAFLNLAGTLIDQALTEQGAMDAEYSDESGSFPQYLEGADIDVASPDARASVLWQRLQETDGIWSDLESSYEEEDEDPYEGLEDGDFYGDLADEDLYEEFYADEEEAEPEAGYASRYSALDWLEDAGVLEM